MLSKIYLNKIFCCDNLTLTRELPDECIDLIVSSPPYNQNRGITGAFGTGSYDKYNDLIDEKLYRKKILRRFTECVRIMKPSASMFIVIGQRAINRELIWPWWITKIKGLTLNGVIIRRFKNSPQLNPVRFLPRYEPIFWLYKEWPPKFNSNFAKLGDVWRIEPEAHKKYKHPAVMPSEVVRRIIKATTHKGDAVYDPFMGIGTTALVAKELGRIYVGCDISENYCRMALDRIKKHQQQKKSEKAQKRITDVWEK